MTNPTSDFYCAKILSGLLEVKVYLENERLFAFHHTNPIWENHVVLLPKRHIESFLTLNPADNELLLELISTAQQIAKELMSRAGGCRVYTNMGSYQSDKHLHWHIGSGRQLRPY
jgi:histidine triad (HIT) family protein